MMKKEIGCVFKMLSFSDFQKFLDTLKKDVGIDMVLCPAGSFMRGDPLKESKYKENEILYKVTLTQPFCIGKYPVTQNVYKKIMKENPSKFKGENNPVEYVSWYDAKEFCNKLNVIYNDKLPENYNFDLPTEAQWEYACRAGTTTSLNSGKNLTSETGRCFNLDEVAWYERNSGKRTHPVGLKRPNAWCIYDMHGNVWEWCTDLYGDYPEKNVSDPVGPNKGTLRVIRGGSWGFVPWFCRSVYRLNDNPYDRYNFIGFRLALVPKQ